MTINTSHGGRRAMWEIERVKKKGKAIGKGKKGHPKTILA